MRFDPPRCPNVSCAHHAAPQGKFFRRRGYYAPECRSEKVPRFVCTTCRRGFSRQTFRQDYRDRRPECNEPLFKLMTSGVGIRQAGRFLELDAHSVQKKLRKLACAMRRLHHNLCTRLPPNATYELDEEETFEHASIRPLTMPVLIEQNTWFVVAAAVGSIRRLAEPGTPRRVRQDEHEARYGPRRDRSNRCVRAVLVRLGKKVPEGTIQLRSDEKTSYPILASQVFGDRLTHSQTPSTIIRGTHNPLFAINTTMAMTRDAIGRMRRQSWLVSKKGTRLADHFYLFLVYRNYVRRRFNHDSPNETPAKLLGLLPKNLLAGEIVAWRQDFGALSVHPMSRSGGETVRDQVPA